MSETKLDRTDKDIIQALKKDARKSIVDLAKEVGVSRPTIMKRIDRLLEEQLIEIKVGMNLKKMGFVVGCIGLEVDDPQTKKKLYNYLLECPRVLLILCPFEKSTFSIYIFGENIETLRSVIYSFNNFPNTKVSYASYSDPPVFPKSFPVNFNKTEKSDTPCGQKCIDCYSYSENLCVGCPAIREYKGTL